MYRSDGLRDRSNDAHEGRRQFLQKRSIFVVNHMSCNSRPRLTFDEYTGSIGEGFIGMLVSKRRILKWTYQKDGLFQSKFLHATLDDIGAEGNNACLI
jgi:hypothetical protein